MQKERIDKLNEADSMIFQTENQLKELGDKIPADKKTAIESALQALKDAHKSGDISAIDAAIKGLNEAWQAASAQMYQQTGANPGADAAGGAGFTGNQQANTSNESKKDEDIQDADFEEVK